MQITPPAPVQTALCLLKEQGYEAYLVGGCVRDALRGVPPHDWDICTNALPEQTMNCFPQYPIIPTGLKHGTVTLLIENTPLEITTFRVDGAYSDGRHPDGVTFTPSLEEDLARRDFTINAMAWSPDRGLIDPFGGQADLADGCIRCVGEAHTRFCEDALRILRGLRFAARLGFSIHPDTAAAVLQDYPRLKQVSAERISAELLGLLQGQQVEEIFSAFASVFCEILPPLAPLRGLEQNHPRHLYDGYTHTIKAVQAAPADPVIRLAMLFHDVGKPACKSTDSQGIDHFYGHPAVSRQLASDMLKVLKLDNHTIQRTETLIEYHDAVIPATPAAARRWLGRLGEENLRALLAVKRADRSATRWTQEDFAELDALEECLNQVLAQQQCFSLKDLAVNGKDLLAVGIPSGPQMGKLLHHLLELVIEQPQLNEKEILLAHIKESCNTQEK